MKRFRFVIPILIGAIAFGGLPLVHGQNAFSTAAIQAWKQSITAAGFMGAPRYTTAALPTCDTNNTGALAFDTTVGALKVCSGSAYVVGGFIGGTVTTPILFPDGTALAPSIAWSSDADGTGTGLYRRGANVITFTNGGTASAELIGGGQFKLPSTGLFQFLTGAIGSGTGIYIGQESAAVLELGIDLTTAAVDQTIAAADAITNADISGGDLTIQSGSGMGTGTVSALIFQTPTIAAAGANAQSLANRLRIDSASIDIGTTAGNPNLTFLGTGTAGAVIASNTAASGGTDRGFDFTVAGNLAAGDTVFRIGDNGGFGLLSLNGDGSMGLVAGLVTLSGTGAITSASTITSSATGSLGWSIVSAANQACTTTCTSAAVHGWDTASGEVAVDATDASADKCLCAGGS